MENKKFKYTITYNFNIEKENFSKVLDALNNALLPITSDFIINHNYWETYKPKGSKIINEILDYTENLNNKKEIKK